MHRILIKPFFTLIVVIVGCAPTLGQILSGVDIYDKNCAQCHGKDLKGGNAPTLFDDIWNYGDKKSQKLRNIKFGIVSVGMPAYEETLSDQQINELLAYIDQKVVNNPTEAPALDLATIDYQMKMEIIADGLDTPWAIDFIDEQTLLVTELPGRLRLIVDGKLLDPVKNLPDVLYQGQGGLMDVAIDPDYKTNSWIYLSYSHELPKNTGQKQAGAMTRIIRGKLVQNTWSNQEIIFEAPHDTYRETRHHYGSRIVFDAEGYLYFGIGDRGAGNQAQMTDKPNGKIHRLYRDGRIPEDNPFLKNDALPSIFAVGVRNPQGLGIHPVTGEVWETEHGPMGGDEINIIRSGNNYGWEVITYGKNYNGTIITEEKNRKGMEQPIFYWNPSIAVCGMNFYIGNEFPKWNGYLLTASLKYEDIQLHNVYENRILHSEVILKNAGRVRDVAPGPDGAIYVVLNDPGRVIKLLNAEK